MARKHGRTAPYEIMRQVTGAEPDTPPPVVARAEPAAAKRAAGRISLLVAWGSGVLASGRGFFRRSTEVTASASDETPGTGPAGGVAEIWRAIRRPVALRLPRLALGGLALGLMLTLGAVYWAGARVGHRAALNEGAAGAQARFDGGAAEGDFDAYDVQHLALRDSDGADVPGGAIDLPTEDPRIPGQNYLRLVSLHGEDIDEARQIQAFFQQAGVATILTGDRLFDPASGEKPKGWISVVDVTRGFTREEWYNGEHEPYYTARRALGRAWKAQNKGVGSDLNTMMFYKFTDE